MSWAIQPLWRADIPGGIITSFPSFLHFTQMGFVIKMWIQLRVWILCDPFVNKWFFSRKEPPLIQRKCSFRRKNSFPLESIRLDRENIRMWAGKSQEDSLCEGGGLQEVAQGKSWIHGMVQVGMDLKDHPIPTLLPRTGMPLTIPGCSKAYPWTFPGVEQPGTLQATPWHGVNSQSVFLLVATQEQQWPCPDSCIPEKNVENLP